MVDGDIKMENSTLPVEDARTRIGGSIGFKQFFAYQQWYQFEASTCVQPSVAMIHRYSNSQWLVSWLGSTIALASPVVTSGHPWVMVTIGQVLSRELRENSKKSFDLSVVAVLLAGFGRNLHG